MIEARERNVERTALRGRRAAAGVLRSMIQIGGVIFGSGTMADVGRRPLLEENGMLQVTGCRKLKRVERVKEAGRSFG